ncbi:MAG: sigma-54-dependent Fis family transcriptional regulator [Planctomycetota bacterium]|nr:MAG: sigma-54-dependent Fis family transcriptional regulator [Planctomycetota bacterium]
MSKMLVVDDEQSICWGLSQLGDSLGAEVVTAASAEQALEAVDRFRPEVVILDVRLPGMDGLSAMSRLRERIGEVPIIVITAYGDLDTAVSAVRNGAFEYIVKPFDLAKVEHVLARALRRVAPAPARGEEPTSPSGNLVGSSPGMQEVFRQIALAAGSDASVLIEGESGTGKELAARAIHRYSGRAAGPFVPVNVASLSSSLAESELFGHVRGAYTGAVNDSGGLLARADGGTLFLGEVAEIPLAVQVKLLRALEYGEIVPVGSETPVETNFRLVSATHQNLLERVEEGSFRHDLFFRLATFHIKIPPLRERASDIGELAQHLLAKLAVDQARPTLSSDALAELESRQWLGNVRELSNAIEHAVILARGGTIEPGHLPPPYVERLPSGTAGRGASLEEALADAVRRWTELQLAAEALPEQLYEQMLRTIEPSLFRAALEKYQGQYSVAARHLGMHRTTLRKKLELYGLIEG